MPSPDKMPWTLSVGFKTDTGKHRERNEDAYYLNIPYPGETQRSFADGIFVVADGMGGHDAGDIASQYAVKAVEDALTDPTASHPAETDRILSYLSALLSEVNRGMMRLAQERGLDRGMGCALTLGVLRGSDLFLAHVGDTRCYRLRNGVFEQLTEDHSWVAQQRKAGLLTPEEEAVHPRRNLLTQALGMEIRLDVFVRHEIVQPNDRYLFCSDGLHGQVDNNTLARVLSEEQPQTVPGRLVRMANESGGPDNITVLAVHVDPGMAGAMTAPYRDLHSDSPVDSKTITPAGPKYDAAVAGTDPGSSILTRSPFHKPEEEFYRPEENQPKGIGRYFREWSRYLIWIGLFIVVVAAGTVAYFTLIHKTDQEKASAELQMVFDALADGEVLILLSEGQEKEARRILLNKLPGTPADPGAQELIRRLGATLMESNESSTAEAEAEPTTAATDSVIVSKPDSIPE